MSAPPLPILHQNRASFFRVRVYFVDELRNWNVTCWKFTVSPGFKLVLTKLNEKVKVPLFEA